MLTVNYLIDKKLPLGHVLTSEDKKALLEENRCGDFSYLSLMKEMFHYKHITIQDLLNGWSGIKIVSIK